MLKSQDIEVRISTDAQGVIDYRTITTNSSGIATVQYTATEAGTYSFEFTYNGTHQVVGCNFFTDVVFTKIPTTLSISSGDGSELEVLQKGTVKVLLTNKNNGNAIKNTTIQCTLEIKDAETGTKIETIYNKKDYTTNSSGIVTVDYTPLTRGDIIGTFSFTKIADNTYQKSNTVTATITWNKIQTTIIAEPVVKVYNGRYTNFYEKDDIMDWTTKSPGVDEDYMTFYARIETINSNTNYINLEGSVVKYNNYSNTTKFEADITDTGDIYGRWTATYSNTKEYFHSLKIVFEGNDLFKPSSKTITYHVLPRIQPIISPSFEPIEEYGGPIRYKVPFNIKAKLTETTEDGTLMGGQYIALTYNEVFQGNFKTNKTTGIMTKQQNPGSIGEKPVLFEYDKEDLIDKYFPATKDTTVTIDKDYTILTIKTGTAVPAVPVDCAIYQ